MLNSWPTRLCVVLCMGMPHTLQIVRNRITNPGVLFPNLIHPNFTIVDAATFSIGEGNIIKGHCSVTCDVSIGSFNVINGFVNIGHDVKIGDYNVMMPGARISGEVEIGRGNLLGADCFIKQRITIGNDVTVSPLSALLTRPKNGMTYIGNPAKIFRF